MDAGTWALAAWLAGFGAVTTALWAGGRRGGRVQAYPLALIVRLGISMEAPRGGRGWLLLRRAGWLGVALMALAMGMGYLLIISTVYAKYIARVEGAQSMGVVPLIPGVTIPWESVPYILIALGVAVVVHEGAHALMARAEGLRVKNAGVAVLAFIPAAFVELDEDEFKGAPLSTKAKVYSAGVASNVLLALAAGALVAYFTAGVLVVDVTGGPALEAGLQPGDVIVAVNGVPVKSVDDLTRALAAAGVSDPSRPATVTLTVLRNGTLVDVVVHKPAGESRIGVLVTTKLTAAGVLVYATSMLNNALALINALPLFVTDGGQLLRDALERLAGRTGLTLSVGIQAATLILVASLITVTRIVLPG